MVQPPSHHFSWRRPVTAGLLISVNVAPFIPHNPTGFLKPLFVKISGTVVINRTRRRQSPAFNPASKLAWAHPEVPGGFSRCSLPSSVPRLSRHSRLSVTCHARYPSILLERSSVSTLLADLCTHSSCPSPTPGQTFVPYLTVLLHRHDLLFKQERHQNR